MGGLCDAAWGVVRWSAHIEAPSPVCQIEETPAGLGLYKRVQSVASLAPPAEDLRPPVRLGSVPMAVGVGLGVGVGVGVGVPGADAPEFCSTLDQGANRQRVQNAW
jgi:hypothetical protein